jgi:3-hydroxybutyryl-CoA dehydrogenase
MKIAVSGGAKMKEELLSQGILEGVEVIWTEDPDEIREADACINFNAGRSLPAILQLVSDVAGNSHKLPAGSIRFNGWPGFLSGNLVEVASENPEEIKKAERIFSCFNKKVEPVPDIPGFIAPRVVCMIINEAFFALEEKVSSKEEIDTAMKLGTNYPFGPFEWAEKIGIKNIYQLLSALSKEASRYQPADSLKDQALAS